MTGFQLILRMLVIAKDILRKISKKILAKWSPTVVLAKVSPSIM